MGSFSAAVHRAFAIAFFMIASVIAPVCALAAPYADYVIDARTGEVLHATNSDTRLHPASLTKMMTLYIAFQAIERGEISLDTVVTVSPYAAGQPPSRLGLRPGQRIALRYLIRAAAIKSANDAAAAIGDAIEGDRVNFAARMNRTAKALGMSRTTFQNANGLTAAGHMSTAHDMTILGRHLFYDFPQYYSIFSRRTADAGMAQVASTNRRFLDSYEGADGIKTGYTGPAGFNLVASAQRGNKRIIATVFGGKSTAQRNARVAELLDLGFGKAPGRVREQPPEPPQLVAEADTADVEGEDFLAQAVASDVNVPAAGKVLRMNAAVTKSLTPKPRGAKPDANGVAVASADTSAPQDAAIAADAEDMVAGTDALMASMQDTINQALAEAQETPEQSGFVRTQKPQPETLAMAAADEDAAEGAGATPEVAGAVDAAVAEAHADAPLALASIAPPAGALHPKARPETLVAAAPESTDGATDTAIADASQIVATKAPMTATTALAAVDPEKLPPPEKTILASASATEAILPVEETLDQTAAMTPVDPADEDLSAKIAVAPGAKDTPPAVKPEKPKAAAIVLAEAATVAPKPAEQEVVTRVSTSGGRAYGINVGSFSSRYAAEKQLLQTALVEMSTLKDALRKVNSRKGAFDANFVGMTEASANLACRKLEARGTDCKVLGATE